jgi:isoquinoline 1-oxidoreductase beta subunit
MATSRRNFLRITSVATGALVLGFDWFSAKAEGLQVLSSAQLAGELPFNSYLSISSDNVITIFSPNPELGQNIKTSFPMVVAEELDADWTKVKVLQGPFDTNRFDRQVTGGSGAVPHSWKRLRKAGATARHMLIEAGSKRWGVSMQECNAANGFVVHTPSGKKLSFGDLAIDASKLTVPAEVKLKDRKDFKLIGTAVKNVENKNIHTGKPLFGLDFTREGMLIAMIQRPASFGTKIKSVDSTLAKAMPGIIDVVTFKNNVAVVGKSTWQVSKAKNALKIVYENEVETESSADHDRIFLSLLESDKTQVRRKDGDVEAAFKNAAKIVKSEYQCPFLPSSQPYGTHELFCSC